MIVLPGYDISEVLYQGSRSLVCRAIRQQDNLAVVLKILSAPGDTTLLLEQFRREFRLASQLEHPGIVRALELQQLSLYWVLSMEDSEAVSLDRLLAEGGIAGDDTLWCRIAIQAAEALNYLHQQGITHKDINPANLIWSPQRKQLQLIDFGISSELQQEVPTMQSLALLEGTLNYLAPEQSGRMNRTLDYRADFYSLGATLYELWCGQPPFCKADPVELVHCHMAEAVSFEHPRFADAPLMLKAILTKLLAKNPEDRYQHAATLQHDLQQCLAVLAHKLADSEQLLEEHNTRLQLPQYLFGRDRETAELLQAYAGIRHGRAGLVLITGQSGMGKTALVHEVHKPMTAQHGYYTAGKCDQYKRNQPYAALVMALGDLLGQLLTEPAEKLAELGRELRQKLGDYTAELCSLLPELPLLIGEGHSAQALSAQEGQNRLHRQIEQLIATIATPSHPLVMFLDDLQWADSPTLQLMEKLLTSPQGMPLLLIGAYRDNELEPGHGIHALTEKLQQAGVPVNCLALSPLSLEDISQLLAAALDQPVASCRPLAECCLNKTAGNPFFLSQFLHTIHDNGLLLYRHELQSWSWSLQAIDDAGFADNVVDLMVEKIRKLPALTQTLMQLAASLGNRFDLETLAVIANLSAYAIHHGLWPALQQDLLRPQDGRYKYLSEDHLLPMSYRFLHDRVQQAAYALSSASEQQKQHLHIGRCLLASYAGREDKLFAITEQLNAAHPLISDPAERISLARLNLQAGRKAKEAAAYLAANRHMQQAMSLLPTDADQALRRDILLGLAETSYLCGLFEQAEALYPAALACCQSPLEQAECHLLHSSQLLLQGRNHEAIAIQHLGLSLLGMPLPQDEQAMQSGIQQDFAALADTLFSMDEAWLLSRPEMSDPASILAMQLLLGMCQATYLSGQLTPYMVSALAMVKTSLAHGHSDLSPLGYVLHAFLVGALFGQFKEGDKVGRSAVLLADQRGNPSVRGNTHFLYAVFTSHWNRHLSHSLNCYDKALNWSLEGGDLVTVGYLLAVRASDRMIAGHFLPDVVRQCEDDIKLLHHTGQRDMADAARWGSLQPARQLLGEEHDSEAETEFLQRYQAHPLHLAYYYQAKLRTACLLREPDALSHCQQLPLIAISIAGQCKVAEAYTYAGLIIAAALRESTPADDTAALAAQLDSILSQLQTWAHHCPENYQHRQLLLEAEIARNAGDWQNAMALYKQAIELAARYGYTQLQALACERFAELWLSMAQNDIAELYLGKAKTAYQAWGASAKVRELETRYPQLAPRVANKLATRQPATGMQANTTLLSLDLSSILKASLALSSELGMQRVLSRLLDIVLENAGAEHVTLLLQHEQQWQLAARGQGKQIQMLGQTISLDTATDIALPLSALRYVNRTGQVLVEADLANSERFAGDAYCQSRKPRSVLIMPILRFGQVAGLLYLENNLMRNAFSHERVEFLRVLAMQALIAIDNARLYDQLEEQVNERTAHLETIRREQQATLDNALMGIAFIRNRRIIRCNPGFAGMFGYQQSELANQSTRVFYPDEESYQQGEQYLAREFDGHALDRSFRHRSGHDIWCAVQIKYLDPDKADSGIVIVCMDITARKEAEKRMEEARIRAEDATQTKSLFLANMSHEIRTPMNAILGMAQLAMQHQPTPRQAGYLKKILQAGESLQSLLNDILDLSKIESGKLSLELMPLETDELINQVSDLLVLRTKDKAVTPILEIDPQLPAVIEGDRLRIEQILNNLVSNAAKFTDQGQVAIRISVTETQADKCRLRFSVQDSGIGISAEQCAKLFQPFQQADSSITRRFGGTGLGLAICKQLVELMGGEIGVESLPGQGSCFSFNAWFPVLRERELPALPAATRVLLVDDNEHNREAARSALAAIGIAFEEASSGLEALICLQGQSRNNAPFSLMLINQDMSGWNGCETLAQIESAGLSCPSLLISAKGLQNLPDNWQAPAQCQLGDKPLSSLSLYQALIEAQQSCGQPLREQPTPAQTSSDHAGWHDLRLLLVDDNDINREVVLGMLEDSGLVIDIAQNGKEALAIAGDGHFDIILMDVQMPEMDGLEATRHLRANPRYQSTPIIALTANAMESDRQSSLAAGMNDHLSKPVSHRELTSVLERWLPAARAVEAMPAVNTSVSTEQQQRLLRHFLHFYQDMPATLSALCLQREADTIAFHMHGLKSAAAYIGEQRLANAASRIENAIHQATADEAAALLPDLIQVLTKVIANLADTLAMTNDKPYTGHVETLSVTGSAKLASLLLHFLAQADSRAGDCLQQLKKTLPPALHPDCEQIASLLDEIEYETALQYAQNLVSRLSSAADNADEPTTQNTDY